MSDWKYLNQHRCRTGEYASQGQDGFNGFFCINVNGAKVKIIASDGGGWKHVSVSIHNSQTPPSWSLMCKVKDLFFEPEDCVMQLHPPHSDYVNIHNGCLHLWMPTSQKIPMPPKEFV